MKLPRISIRALARIMTHLSVTGPVSAVPEFSISGNLTGLHDGTTITHYVFSSIQRESRGFLQTRRW